MTIPASISIFVLLLIAIALQGFKDFFEHAIASSTTKRTMRTLAFCLVLTQLWGAAAAAENPQANPLSVTTFANARLTFLTSSLVRIELARDATVGWDDRATTTVVNRFLPPVPFTVTPINATSTTVNTSDLSVMLTSTPPCSAQAGFQNNGGTRVPAWPNGTSVSNQTACCAVCQADPDCTAWTFASDSSPPSTNCWLLMGVSFPPTPQPDRVFGSLFDVGISVSFLGASGEELTWSPGAADPANLNGTYSSLDCYTTPMLCNAEYDQKMQPGLLSTAGWAAIDDTATGRFVPAPDNPAGMPTWWSLDKLDLLDVYLHVFPGLEYRAALAEWAAVMGPPSLLPRSAFGVWWSRYYPYSQESIVQEVLQGYANYSIPLNHLVLDMVRGRRGEVRVSHWDPFAGHSRLVTP